MLLTGPNPMGRQLFQPGSSMPLVRGSLFHGRSTGPVQTGQRLVFPSLEETSRNRWGSVTFLSSCVGTRGEGTDSIKAFPLSWWPSQKTNTSFSGQGLGKGHTTLLLGKGQGKTF